MNDLREAALETFAQVPTQNIVDVAAETIERMAAALELAEEALTDAADYFDGEACICDDSFICLQCTIKKALEAVKKARQ